jgi:hypothetical protein
MNLLRRRGRKRSFQRTEAFPVLARSVSVYTLWNRTPVFPDSFPSPPVEILQRPQKIGSWYAIHLTWKPASNTDETPWIDKAETERAFSIMLDYSDQLASAQPAGKPGEARPAKLVFKLLHVRELQVQVPRFYRLRYRKSKDTLQQEVFYTRRSFVLALQEQASLLAGNTQEESLASAYDHYDRDLHSRGWIIINLTRALLVGVNENTVRVLVNLIQCNDIDASRPGISPNCYDEMLGRLGIWNSSQEIGETMDQLGSMISNGNIAINGQVLLTLVLTLIGIVLSIYSIVQPKNWQVQLWISLGILFVASLFFWGYARFGARIWVFLGLLAIAAVLILDTITLWLAPLMRLLSQLHI